MSNSLDELNSLKFHATTVTLASSSVSVSSPILGARPGLTVVVNARKSKLPCRAVSRTSCIIHVPVSRDMSSLGITTTTSITF